MSKHSKQKYGYTNKMSTKSIVVAFVVIALLLISAIYFVSSIFAEPKTPATVDEVWTAIEAQGYKPKDITQTYYDNDSDAFMYLIKCISFDKEDIHFEFFEFNNEDSAKDLYGQAHYKITTTHNSWQKIETDNRMANYRIYTLDANGQYGVAIFVGNTAVYAHSNSQNKNEIDKILEAIDYLKPGNNKETTE
ncbi:MAG: hypothetical protein IKC20_04715 [Clostridia bacterium]|nr:hypothetical protein [Clostridia bacterium]